MKNSMQINADVPPVMMPQIHKNMPMRAPRTSATTSPRNLTGVYLGREKTQTEYPTSIPRHSVPPFMKGKGFWKRVRTPTEERRHQKVELLRDREERRGFSGRPPKRRNVRTPDTLISSLSWKENQGVTTQGQTADSDVLDLTRQTNRFFTAVNNTGVVRLEYLNPPVYDNTTTLYDSEGNQVPLEETVKSEIQRLALNRSDLMGIEECYKKVCKGNINAMHTLLPQRKASDNRRENTLNYTGFTVKSYRNPAQAEIIAHFPDPRPRTTTHQARCNPLPSPYFFKVYNPPKTAAGLARNGNIFSEDASGIETGLARNSTPVFVGASNLKGKTYNFGGFSSVAGLSESNTPFASPRKEKPLSSPHSPSLSRSVITDKLSVTSDRSKVEISVPHAHQVAEPYHSTAEQGDLPHPASQPALQSNQSPPSAGNSDIQSDNRTAESNQSGGVQTSGDDLKGTAEQTSEKVEPGASQSGNDLSGNTETTEQTSEKTETDLDQSKMMPKKEDAHSDGPVILIGVEDESGEQLPVEIDEADDILQKENEKNAEESAAKKSGPIPARKKSITERVNKSRESEKALNELREKAECRQKEFASLLDEHAQIVKEIDYDSDEKSSCTEDKENSRVPANST